MTGAVNTEPYAAGLLHLRWTEASNRSGVQADMKAEQKNNKQILFPSHMLLWARVSSNLFTDVHNAYLT